MKILVLNSVILAIDPIDTGATWETSDQIIPKHVADGAVIVDAILPEDFSLCLYEWDGTDVVQKQIAPTLVPVPEAIEALQGLKAIDQAGLSAVYDAWAKAPERTFLERAFIDKAQTWRRDDPVLIAGAASLGLTSDQVDAMFIAAPGL